MTDYTDWQFDDVANVVGTSAHHLLKQLTLVEDMYQRLLAVCAASGGDDQGFADELFNVGEGESATTSQVAKALRLRLAIVAMHQLYECAHDVSVTQRDRAADLRLLAMPQVVLESRR